MAVQRQRSTSDLAVKKMTSPSGLREVLEPELAVCIYRDKTTLIAPANTR